VTSTVEGAVPSLPGGLNATVLLLVVAVVGTAWRTPRLETLERPALSAARRIGLLVLRGYMLFAIAIIAIKLVQVTS